jgi:hypothetical protein
MGRARPSVTKRQREQVKRERKLRKAEKRAERKNAGPDSQLVSDSEQPVSEEAKES